MKTLLRVVTTIGVSLSFTVLAAPTAEMDKRIDDLRAKAKARGWTFSVGYNEVMDYGLKSSTGYIKDPKVTAHGMYVTPAPRRLPAHWDWREQTPGGLTPIKNQKSCGSCWAFGTVAAIESIVKIRDGVTHVLSEQQLVSCNDDGFSCGGGNFAHQYHVKPGATTEQEFPYVARDVRCKQGLTYNDKIESWAYIGKSGQRRASVDDIKNAIYQYGPVTVTVAATDSMMSYNGGIYNDCDSEDTNHIVAIVGWDDDGGYWIMRNSWGSSWGENGYMRIKYNCSAIAEEATYVNYKTACTPQPISYPGEDMMMKVGSKVRLGGMPIPGQTYSWSPTTGLDNPSSATPYASPPQTTTYTLTATNNCGVATKTVTVTVNQQ